eukprot:GHVT01007115.1.p1 GENE.GHVT01007115.1~~GHVT01007115.1.p1  ORF type:complete len:306 (+),score=60.34 GHVT01007115.1:214-1131(+)
MGLPDQEPAGVSNFFDSDAVTSYELDDSLLEEASKVVAENHEAIPEFWREKYSRESVKSWDVFYKRNGSRFFKDRQWTGKEFAELSGHSAAEPCCAGDSSAASSAAESGGPLPEATAQKPPEECEQFFTRGLGEDFEPQGPPPPHAEPPTRPAQLPAAQGRATQLLVDCGSGVGNALLPMLKRNPNLRGIAFDCSERAILLLQVYDWCRVQVCSFLVKAVGRLPAFVGATLRLSGAAPLVWRRLPLFPLLRNALRRKWRPGREGFSLPSWCEPCPSTSLRYALPLRRATGGAHRWVAPAYNVGAF